MNAAFTPARRMLTAVLLAATLTSLSAASLATAAEASSPAQPPSLIDGIWAMATCSFAIALTYFQPSFANSAGMICAYVFTVD